ncbi:TAXI family TRAP transporter solute-binding subunit [Amycolatopsis sp.]|uniref:TAXI family TRAP transporter solute-binding subunit n=1 Tax=Amycolatopsis sp. TaxID=37632 RepID=UPI002E08EE23|nr:TAXI family TRAP transporter solute-binding subunit [Amycolatopsis sp.]
MVRLRGIKSRGAALSMVVLVLCGLLSSCGPDFNGLRVRIAAGTEGGVYYQLATPLASAWATQMGIQPPEVQMTAGSPDNVQRLKTGQADVGFSAADVAANANQPGTGPKFVALARIYDDYLHVVVRDDSPITSIAMLRGRRVAVGSPDSGVEVIARKLVTTGLGSYDDVDHVNLGLTDALNQLELNQVDAVFWSGGLPTKAIVDKNATTKLRLVDIGDVLPQLLRENEVYRTATIPASTYQLENSKPVTTLIVSNFLLVSSAMSDDEAEALVRGLFDARPRLVAANRAALSIDVRPAIETAPLELHPGALRYYRSIKP